MNAEMFRRSILGAALALTVTGRVAAQVSNVDPVHKWCWGENTGFVNWRDAGAPRARQGVVIGATFLSGFAWCENAGFVNLGDGTPGLGDRYSNTDGLDAGVNIDPATRELSGLAWGENIGWINFDTRASLGPFGQQARLDLAAGRLRGYAWSENTGWLNLDDAQDYVATGCGADFNCSGQVGVQDIFDFLAAYFAGCAGASTRPPCSCRSPDYDGSGTLSVEDIFVFLTVYFRGCR